MDVRSYNSRQKLPRPAATPHLGGGEGHIAYPNEPSEILRNQKGGLNHPVGAALDPPLRAVASRPATAGSTSVRLAQTLKAIADPKRLQVLSLLTQGERCVCEIGHALGLPQTLVSHHLAVLRRAGLVRGRRDQKDGRWVYYSINKQALACCNDQYLALLDVNRIEERVACCDEEGNPIPPQGCCP